FTAARAVLHEFRVVLLVPENDFIFVNNRRDSTTVLADERPEVALPDRFAVVVERGEQVMLWFVPDNVNALGIDGGRRCSEAVVRVPCEWSKGKIAAPKQASILSAQAEHGNAAGFIASACEKNPLAPQDGRRVTGAGQFDFPVDVCLGDFGGDRFGVANAGAIRAPKAGPFLRLAVEPKSCHD